MFVNSASNKPEVKVNGWTKPDILVTTGIGILISWAKKSPAKGLIGGQGRNRTGVDGFAGRSITTLPPGLGETSRASAQDTHYSTIRDVTMPCVKSARHALPG